MNKKFLFVVLAIMMISAIVLSGCAAQAPAPSATPSPTPTPTAEAKVLKIGVIDTLTGPSSDILKLAADGATLAKEWFNNKGGITIKGQKYLIDIDIQDNKMSVDGAVAAANKLVNDQGIKFISGSYPPFISNGITSVTEPAHVLYGDLYNCGQKEEYGPQTPYKFVTCLGSLEGQKSSMIFLKEKHPEVKTIAYVLVDDGQIRDNDPVVRATAEKLGFTIVGDIVGWTLDTVDFTPIAQKAVSRNADAIMTGNGSTDQSGSILKLARQMGYTKPIFQSNVNPAVDVLKIAGKEAATNYFAKGISADTPDMPQITQEAVKLAVAKYGRLDIAQLYGFNGMYVLVNAIEKAQSLDPTEVRDFMAKMTDVDTAFGPGKMTGLQTYGINHTVVHPIPIQLLENGELKPGRWMTVDECSMEGKW